MDKVKEILAENKDVWKTEASYWSFVRGGLRRGLWMRNPVKLKLKARLRAKIPNPDEKKREGRFAEIWGNQCDLCCNWYPQAEVEVDHIHGHHSLRSEDDLMDFFRSIAFVRECELQLICKTCHKIKSYAERMNITFDEAKLTKQVIELVNLGKDKDYLLQLGVTNDNIPSTKDKRRQLLLTMLIDQLDK